MDTAHDLILRAGCGDRLNEDAAHQVARRIACVCARYPGCILLFERLRTIKTGQASIVQRGGFSGRYTATRNGGRLIYSRGGTLFAAPFDPDRLTLTGAAVAVVEGVSASMNGGGAFAVSTAGTLVYLAGKGQGVRTISWIAIAVSFV